MLDFITDSWSLSQPQSLYNTRAQKWLAIGYSSALQNRCLHTTNTDWEEQNILQHPNCSVIHQWWSLETWSRSRDASRDPFFEVSVSKVSGLVSVSKNFGLELFVLH